MSKSKDILAALADDDGTLISIRLVMKAMMREFGGPECFGAMVADDYMHTDKGSPQRVQLGGKILQALQNFGGDDVPQSASEEDVQALIADVIKDMQAAREMAGEGAANDH